MLSVNSAPGSRYLLIIRHRFENTWMVPELAHTCKQIDFRGHISSDLSLKQLYSYQKIFLFEW
jgi:hypothetical protein